jgi:hypothetical protein
MIDHGAEMSVGSIVASAPLFVSVMIVSRGAGSQLGAAPKSIAPRSRPRLDCSLLPVMSTTMLSSHGPM